MLSIQTNVSALNAEYNLNQTSNSLQSTMQQLSSGYRINSAADDAAGLAISEQMTAQIGGLNQASQNAQDGISMIQTADGGLSQIQSMMQRMSDLAVQAASGNNSQTDEANINIELQQLQQEVDSIANTTTFNGTSLLNGSLSGQQRATSYLTSGTPVELTAGSTVGGGSVVAVDVSGAQAGTGYELSSSTNGTVTLAQINSSGVTTGQSETVDLPTTVAAGGSATLNFSQFGISLTVAASGGGGGIDATQLETAFSSSADLTVDVGTAGGAATFQTGANQGQTTNVAFVNATLDASTTQTQMAALYTDLTAFNTAANGTNLTAATTAAGNLITSLNNALNYISSTRATIGAAQDRLQDAISNLGTESDNLSSANSGIVDVDVASSSAQLSQEQVLEQAGVSVLAQANQMPQLALKLLGS
ncbi:MAG: flagellin [Polyangia bacterium]